MNLREELAGLEHEQWWKWAYDIINKEKISKERLDRWYNECFKPYSELTEEMKEFDREWADKVLVIIKRAIEELHKNKSKDVPKGLTCACGKCDLIRFSSKELTQLLSKTHQEKQE